MYNTTTPQKVTGAIKRLCSEINDEKPYYVAIKQESTCLKNECFWNVKSKVEKCGGKIQYGWTIWEWPRVLVEAEFHAIWISPDNNPIDITPKEYNVQKILFLPDNKREYDFNKDGLSIQNIRRPLSKNPLILDFIRISEKISDFENEHSEGHKIHIVGNTIDIYENLKRTKIALQIKIQHLFSPLNQPIGRNDMCPCGSGKKYKRCCLDRNN